jgi:phage I-like protein
MTDLEHLANREPLPDRTVAAGETIEGVQLCPVGDWPNGGRPQRCTAEALRNVVEAWKADGSREILVDFEHNAEQGGTSDTSAAAWATNLRVDPERGLVADFRMTDAGAAAVSNRRLRFLSVAWLVDRATREPLRLTSIALTNKPNIPVAPVLNREPPAATTVEETQGNQNMEKLKELLGLGPEATDDDVAAAVKALQDKVAESDRAAAEREAEEFAEANKAKADRNVLKAQFLANREVAKALVAAIPEPKAPETAQRLLNKSDAKTPEAADIVKELNKLPAGKARADFVMAHAAELAAAGDNQ